MLIVTTGDNVSINTLTMGDSLSFSVNSSSYPATEWTMNFSLTLNGSGILDEAATPDGDSHDVDLSSAETLALTPGRCQAWLVFTNISDPTQRFTQSAGTLVVLPNPLGALPQTENMQALKAVARTISLILREPASSVSFNGQSFTVHNLADLYAIRDRLKQAVEIEFQELGIPTKTGFKTIRTRFV